MNEKSADKIKEGLGILAGVGLIIAGVALGQTLLIVFGVLLVAFCL